MGNSYYLVFCRLPFLEMITNNLLENHLASKEEISRMNAITYAEQIKEDAGISITNS